MKSGILFAVLIFFHIAWIGTLTLADASSESRVHLPQEIAVSSVLLIAWVAYQALSWAHSGILKKNK